MPSVQDSTLPREVTDDRIASRKLARALGVRVSGVGNVDQHGSKDNRASPLGDRRTHFARRSAPLALRLRRPASAPSHRQELNPLRRGSGHPLPALHRVHQPDRGWPLRQPLSRLRPAEYVLTQTIDSNGGVVGKY